MLTRHSTLPVGLNLHSQALKSLKSIPILKRPLTSSVSSPYASSFGELPHDIWDAVFAYLQLADLVTIAQLNTTFYIAVTTSLPWRFYKNLFPTSRRIWALTWKEALDGYFARTVPLTGRESMLINHNATGGQRLPQELPFKSLFIGTDRRLIEFFGPSVRHRHDTFLTQTDHENRTCKSWRITSTPQYSMSQIISVKKKELELPPPGHHLRPAGLDIVGTFLFWVDYVDFPLPFTILRGKRIRFDEVGENVLWPEGIFDVNADELCLLHKLILSWGESQFEFSGQMVSAAANVRDGGRKQILRLFDYATGRAYSIPFDTILGEQGPWLGPWQAPWILPWGFDDDGNLLFKILDTKFVNNTEQVRCIQTSFNLASMRTTFSLEILENIQLLSPWNFQMFSDQCWGYPVKDGDGNIWCILRDLRDGNLVRRVGPLNRHGTHPTDYSCHISMFHVIFQDKTSTSRSARIATGFEPPWHAPLRIFPIKPLSPAVQRQYRFPSAKNSANNSQLLYEMTPPPFISDPPGYWTFGGEDAAERYLFFQGSPEKKEDHFWSDDWKKWVIWDSVRREWTYVRCERDSLRGDDGFYCLFSAIDVRFGKERIGLDWVRMELM